MAVAPATPTIHILSTSATPSTPRPPRRALHAAPSTPRPPPRLPIHRLGLAPAAPRRRPLSVSKSHCYDPNEEARLRKVIRAVGEDTFNTKIRNLAMAYEAEQHAGWSTRAIKARSSTGGGSPRSLVNRLSTLGSAISPPTNKHAATAHGASGSASGGAVEMA